MRFSRSLTWTLGFACLYVVASYAGRLTIMDSTNLSLVWPAAGVSAVWFLAQRSSRWFSLDVLVLTAVTMVVNVATGAPALLAGFFVIANMLQAMVFVALFRRWLPHLWGGGGDQPLARLRELWLVAAAAFLSTAAGALIGPTGVWLVEGAYSWPATGVWLTRNTVSILLLGVAGIRLGQLLHGFSSAHRSARLAALRRHWSAMTGLRRLEYVSVVMLSALGYYAVFGINHHLPLAFTVIVMSVWAGLRLHTGFVILHDIFFGAAAILFTLHHTGVFAGITSHTARALVVQAFVGMVAVVGLALALGRDERAALVAGLNLERQSATDHAALLAAIVDSMSEGLTVIDTQGRFLLRNPAVRDLLGGVVSNSEAIARPGFYGLAHPDGSPLEAEDMPHRRALAGSDVHGMDILVRNPGVPDGRILQVSSTAMRDQIGGHRYAVTVFHDVTAERRHRDELTSFAGVVAHDLVNPLATIEGWSESLAETFAETPELPAAAQAADAVTRIRRAALRMRTMIDDLLGYTTARDATIAVADVLLDEVAADIATARIDQAQSTGTAAPLFTIDAPHTVPADPVLIRQLLDNLVSNAIKYTAPGVTPAIAVTSRLSDGLVIVSITDNGIGIPDGHHDSIFDNFHRAHRGAGYTGTGLGLGICRRIVERHGGTITATDNPGGGSQFIFTLPTTSRAASTGTIETGPSETARTYIEGVNAAPEPALTPPASVSTAPPAIPPEQAIEHSATAPDAPPSAGFDHAARMVLNYLHDHMPLAFWSVTRVQNGRQTYLYLDPDNGYGLRQGASHAWEDSYCIHMAAGTAPTVALDAQAVPAYARAGVNAAIDIGTYAGAVINEPDGTLFGAICGLDPQARTTDPRMATAAPLLALLGELLSSALAADQAQHDPADAPSASDPTPQRTP
jgi:PAS domain S-box-containing protein